LKPHQNFIISSNDSYLVVVPAY